MLAEYGGELERLGEAVICAWAASELTVRGAKGAGRSDDPWYDCPLMSG